MFPAPPFSLAMACLLLAACASTKDGSERGERVGVNSVAKSAPVTGSVAGGLEPAPSAMATTTASGGTTDPLR